MIPSITFVRVHKKMLGISLMVAMTTITSQAMDHSWEMSIGVNYRHFDDIDFKSFSLRNGAGNDVGGPFGLQNLAGVQPNLPDPSQVTVDTVVYSGSSDDADFSDSLSPVLRLEKILHFDDSSTVDETFSVGLMIGFHYYDVGVSATEHGNNNDTGEFIATQNTYDVLSNEIIVPTSNSATGFGAGTQVSVENDFDMSLYVIDFGIKPTIDNDVVSANIIVGVSVNFVDIDSSQTETGNYNAIPNAVDTSGNPVSGPYRVERNDDQSAVVPGIFLGGGVDLYMTKRFLLGFEYRYDLVADSRAETDLAELSLSGHSASARVIYRF